VLFRSRIYSQAILRLRKRLNETGADLLGVSHVTGGGLPGNVPRVIPAGLGARLHPGNWPMPSIMRLLGVLGSLSEGEIRSTFNGGLGMVCAVPLESVETAISSLEDDDLEAWHVGEIIAIDADEPRYLES
jgi:phosphoribosylformylglycinamidine cyclo-ligase